MYDMSHLTFYEWCVGAGSALQAIVILVALINFSYLRSKFKTAWFYFVLSMILVFARRIVNIAAETYFDDHMFIFQGIVYVIISALWLLFVISSRET